MEIVKEYRDCDREDTHLVALEVSIPPPLPLHIWPHPLEGSACPGTPRDHHGPWPLLLMAEVALDTVGATMGCSLEPLALPLTITVFRNAVGRNVDILLAYMLPLMLLKVLLGSFGRGLERFMAIACLPQPSDPRTACSDSVSKDLCDI